MPPSAATQRSLQQQFTNLTGASERQASRFLRSTNYKLPEAVDAYYSSGGGNAEVKNASVLEGKLNPLFDSLRNDERDEKDLLELESTMSYLSETLGVGMEDAELFVALEVLQAPMIGEVKRQGYVEGWKATGVNASHEEHAAHIKGVTKSLANDTAAFKKVYRYAFIVGKEKDQKALGLENALIYWSMLFAAPGMVWKSANHDWLDLWKTFLEQTWTRSVSKDMWNMTLEFAVKSMDDETLSFWNEDGAWPAVIDDFVAWCRQKGIGKDEVMEVDGEQA